VVTLPRLELPEDEITKVPLKYSGESDRSSLDTITLSSSRTIRSSFCSDTSPYNTAFEKRGNSTTNLPISGLTGKFSRLLPSSKTSVEKPPRDKEKEKAAKAEEKRFQKEEAKRRKERIAAEFRRRAEVEKYMQRERIADEERHSQKKAWLEKAPMLNLT
jgi:hypothetical protein